MKNIGYYILALLDSGRYNNLPKASTLVQSHK